MRSILEEIVIFYNLLTHGLVVKVSDFSGFESLQGLWILSCEEAIQLAYGMTVVLFRCPFVPEIMHGRAPAVFLYQ
jgi:hypothetical protein